jgi:hypothetical protein
VWNKLSLSLSVAKKLFFCHVNMFGVAFLSHRPHGDSHTLTHTRAIWFFSIFMRFDLCECLEASLKRASVAIIEGEFYLLSLDCPGAVCFIIIYFTVASRKGGERKTCFWLASDIILIWRSVLSLSRMCAAYGASNSQIIKHWLGQTHSVEKFFISLWHLRGSERARIKSRHFSSHLLVDTERESILHVCSAPRSI